MINLRLKKAAEVLAKTAPENMSKEEFEKEMQKSLMQKLYEKV